MFKIWTAYDLIFAKIGCFNQDVPYFDSFRLPLVKKNRQNGKCIKSTAMYKKKPGP